MRWPAPPTRSSWSTWLPRRCVAAWRTAPAGLDAHRQLLAVLDGRYAEVTGMDVAASLVNFARAENATQLVLGASRRSRWSELTRGSVINQVVRAAGPIDVHVISPTD